MPRMRTISEAYKEIKSKDANTSMTPYFLRRLVLLGEIPSIKAGRKYLVNMDMLDAYLSAGNTGCGVNR